MSEGRRNVGLGCSWGTPVAGAGFIGAPASGCLASTLFTALSMISKTS
jgi:hypothetical protein